MNVRWIILVYILKIHLKCTTFARHHYHRHSHYEDLRRQPHYEDEDDAEESEETNSGHATSGECYCNCDTCFTRDQKTCCDNFCKYCQENVNVEQQQPPQQPYQNPEQKVVFVPFPYPLIIPNNHAQNYDSTVTTEITQIMVLTSAAVTETVTAKSITTNTIMDTTTTPQPPPPEVTIKARSRSKSKLRSKSVEVEMLSRHRKMKQLNPAVKRTKTPWVPKYGIVPIPDHLAAKLMTQLTEVRALKAKKL